MMNNVTVQLVMRGMIEIVRERFGVESIICMTDSNGTTISLSEVAELITSNKEFIVSDKSMFHIVKIMEDCRLKRIGRYEKKTEKVLETKVEVKQIPKYTIENFNIPETEEVLFKNGYAYTKLLDTISSLDHMYYFLKNSSHRNTEVYLSITSKLKKDLVKLVDSIEGIIIPEDEVSEYMTNKFGKIISRFINDTSISIYRGLEYKPEKFYFDFINQINNYFSNCNIYTKLILPGSTMIDDYYYILNIMIKPTTNAELHSDIYEVEKLPYFINYIDEDGEMQKYIIEGSATLYKYEK